MKCLRNDHLNPLLRPAFFARRPAEFIVLPHGFRWKPIVSLPRPREKPKTDVSTGVNRMPLFCATVQTWYLEKALAVEK